MELIESVGSEHLLEAIEAQAAKLELVQDILLEVNIGGEASKSGISPEELSALAAQAEEAAGADAPDGSADGGESGEAAEEEDGGDD